ncbi:hypothetical protein LINPERPRIM_LOCUS41651 [Linum perenne]
MRAWSLSEAQQSVAQATVEEAHNSKSDSEYRGDQENLESAKSDSSYWGSEDSDHVRCNVYADDELEDIYDFAPVYDPNYNHNVLNFTLGMKFSVPRQFRNADQAFNSKRGQY